MIDYGLVKSSVEPLEVEILETKVFVSKNVKQVEETVDEQTFNGFQFNLVEYDKDEYIEMLNKKNEELEKSITETQLALCDVYELIGG